MKLKKSTAGKVLTVSLLLIGIGVTSCKKEVDTAASSEEKRGIESWKTLEDYPSEITLDNWEEFVYAPKHVLAHFEEQERLEGRSNGVTKSNSTIATENKLPLGPSGLIRLHDVTNSSFVQFPRVTVRNCNNQTVSNDLGGVTNYSLPGNCTFDQSICMTVEPVFLPNGGMDLSLPTAGITALDLVLIQKHILGIEVFTEPAEYIAADTNRDGQITGIDIIHIRKIQLGIYSDWPDSENYLFIDDTDYANFDWWELDIYGQTDPCNGILSTNRIGVKTGDVNGSIVSDF